jgi:hypothetical protein
MNMNFEVCINALQRNGCEVASSDFFNTIADALSFAHERLSEIEESGDYVSGCVTVFEDGRVFDSLSANPN